jgi:hypothetical protein
MNHIQLIADGQRWNASYTVQGDEVCVASAYGGKRAKVGKGVEPEAVALSAFEAVIKQRSPALKRTTFKPGQIFRAFGR